MNVSNGNLVRYRIRLFNRLMSFGEFEILARFPDQVPLSIREKIVSKSVGYRTRFPFEIKEEFYDDSLLIRAPKNKIKSESPLKEGMILSTKLNGKIRRGSIKNIGEDDVLIDCNYPLTGQRGVKCDLKIVSVTEPSSSDSSSLNNGPITTVV